MSLLTTKLEAASAKQKLKFMGAPNVCIIPAPPPPAGPKGIPTPFPITIDTGTFAKKPVPKVKHLGGKTANTDSIFKGVKGNNAGVGDMVPGTPKKDILTGVLTSKGFAIAGSPNCKCGGSSFIMTGAPGMANNK